MSLNEKALFCQIVSSLFVPPTQERIEEFIQGDGWRVLTSYLPSRNRDGDRLKGFHKPSSAEQLFIDLKEEYDRLFSDTGREKIPLVESPYKPWTADVQCPLPFARQKGFMMGDSALHLLAIFEELGLEVAEPFEAMPDHIVTELEFLSFLYELGREREAQRFMADHLDWIPSLKERLEGAQAHPFYTSLVEALDSFIQHERVEERGTNGKKDVHPEVV